MKIKYLFVIVYIIICVYLLKSETTSYPSFNPAIENCANSYDERGFSKNGNSTIKDNVSISNANGNVLYNYPLKSFPSVNDIPITTTLIYNANVKHIAYAYYYTTAEGNEEWRKLVQNRPEWIIGINGFAVQVLAHANSFVCPPTNIVYDTPAKRIGAGSPTYDENSTITWTIDGYDNCSGFERYSSHSSTKAATISILKADGSLLELISANCGATQSHSRSYPRAYIGLFYNKEANSKGYGIVEPMSVNSYTTDWHNPETMHYLEKTSYSFCTGNPSNPEDGAFLYRKFMRRLRYFPGDGNEYIFEEDIAPYSSMYNYNCENPMYFLLPQSCSNDKYLTYQNYDLGHVDGTPTIFYLKVIKKADPVDNTNNDGKAVFLYYRNDLTSRSVYNTCNTYNKEDLQDIVYVLDCTYKSKDKFYYLGRQRFHYLSANGYPHDQRIFQMSTQAWDWKGIAYILNMENRSVSLFADNNYRVVSGSLYPNGSDGVLTGSLKSIEMLFCQPAGVNNLNLYYSFSDNISLIKDEIKDPNIDGGINNKRYTSFNYENVTRQYQNQSSDIPSYNVYDFFPYPKKSCNTSGPTVLPVLLTHFKRLTDIVEEDKKYHLQFKTRIEDVAGGDQYISDYKIDLFGSNITYNPIMGQQNINIGFTVSNNILDEMTISTKPCEVCSTFTDIQKIKFDFMLPPSDINTPQLPPATLLTTTDLIQKTLKKNIVIFQIY